MIFPVALLQEERSRVVASQRAQPFRQNDSYFLQRANKNCFDQYCDGIRQKPHE